MSLEAVPESTAAAVAFEEAMLPHLDAVLRYASYLEKDRGAGEDLAQETFLRAFRARHTFTVGSDPRRWLFTICRNHFLSGRRRPDRDVASLDEAGMEGVAFAQMHAAARRDGVDLLMSRLDLGPALQRALATLPEGQRVVVALVDVEGLEYAEAAAALEIAVGTVRSRLFRARRVLQEQLIAYARDAGFVTAARPASDEESPP